MIRPVFRRKEGIALGISIILFIVGIIVGSYLVKAYPQLIKEIIQEAFKNFQRLLNLSGWRLALGIYLNNLRVAILLFLVGAIIPILPSVIIFINGLFIGIVAEEYLAATSATMTSFLLALAPHGIFELPAIFLAAAIGSILGWDNWRAWLTGTPHPGWKTTLRYAWVWFLIVGLLLIPAAIIEVFLTPAFIR